MDLKLPFALRGSELVEVAQVERGLACGCVCPACGHRLIARKGEKTIHHFAHGKSSMCGRAVETALHFAAKEILERRKEIRVPPVFVPAGAGYGRRFRLYEEQIVRFDRVQLEKKLDNIVPDVIIELMGRKMIVEIAVTHFIDEAKHKKLRQLDISTLEVDLSKVNRQISLADLEEILIDGLENKKWTINTKAIEVRRKLEIIGVEHEIVHRGMAAHIDNCPIRARVWKGRPYANLIDDCFYCDYFFDSRGNEWSSHTHITCLGHEKEKIDQIISRQNVA